MKENVNKMKQNLIHIKDNLYIHPSDNLYHEKLLKYVNPNNAESHYFLGIKYDRLGKKKKAISHYVKAIQLGSSHKEIAAVNLARLQEPSKKQLSEGNGDGISRSTPATTIAISIIITLLLLNFVLIFLLFQLKDNPGGIASIPYVEEKKEEDLYAIPLPEGKSASELELALYEETMRRVVEGSTESFVLYGTLYSEKVMVASYEIESSPNVKITYLSEDLLSEKVIEMRETVVATNIVRTALQTYIEDYGAPPDKVEYLVNDFPFNYLSAIPIEHSSNSNLISHSFSQQGGWVYNRDAASVEDMFYPNTSNRYNSLPYTVDMIIPYHPIQVVIAKDSHTLQLRSGNFLIAEKSVGLGKDNLTPEGKFPIHERVLHPQGHKANMFGAAGLGLGDIAIHGTMVEESIGANLSLGCIRMNNNDILEVFPLIPKGTVVTILPHFNRQQHLTVLHNVAQLFPTKMPSIVETSIKTFTWAN